MILTYKHMKTNLNFLCCWEMLCNSEPQHLWFPFSVLVGYMRLYLEPVLQATNSKLSVISLAAHSPVSQMHQLMTYWIKSAGSEEMVVSERIEQVFNWS